jgi:hypothetical protein
VCWSIRPRMEMLFLQIEKGGEAVVVADVFFF